MAPVGGIPNDIINQGLFHDFVEEAAACLNPDRARADLLTDESGNPVTFYFVDSKAHSEDVFQYIRNQYSGINTVGSEIYLSSKGGRIHYFYAGSNLEASLKCETAFSKAELVLSLLGNSKRGLSSDYWLARYVFIAGLREYLKAPGEKKSSWQIISDYNDYYQVAERVNLENREVLLRSTESAESSSINFEDEKMFNDYVSKLNNLTHRSNFLVQDSILMAGVVNTYSLSEIKEIEAQQDNNILLERYARSISSQRDAMGFGLGFDYINKLQDFLTRLLASVHRSQGTSESSIHDCMLVIKFSKDPETKNLVFEGMVNGGGFYINDEIIGQFHDGLIKFFEDNPVPEPLKLITPMNQDPVHIKIEGVEVEIERSEVIPISVMIQGDQVRADLPKVSSLNSIDI